MTSENEPSWDELKDQASVWLARLDSGNATREDFESWRSADPRHAVAFAQVAHVLQQIDRVKPAYKMRQREAVAPSRRNALLAVGGLAAVVAVGAGAYIASGAGRAQASTGLGDRRSLGLPRGQQLDLNTETRAQWKVGDGETSVWLLKGELAMSSNGAPTKLFAAGSVVTLTRGAINARLRGNLLDLAVITGQCEVEQDRRVGTGKPAVSLKMSQAILSGGAAPVIRSLDQADVRFITAWPRDELVFEGQTLGTAVAEYNRYLAQKIVIADPSLSGIRIGGRFTTHDPKPFLDALHAGFGISAITDGAGTIALSK